MRGGDEFRMRASPESDDSDDESSAAVNKRRRQAKSTLAESWRLYLMQIPRQSLTLSLLQLACSCSCSCYRLQQAAARTWQ